jgi:hypothetical protein
VPLDSPVKDPSRIRRGQTGARARWGAPRIVRLDSLTAAQRDLVLALVQTMKTAPAVSETSAGAVTPEVSHAGQPSTD